MSKKTPTAPQTAVALATQGNGLHCVLRCGHGPRFFYLIFAAICGAVRSEASGPQTASFLGSIFKSVSVFQHNFYGLKAIGDPSTLK